jgi:pyruvate kinase
MKLRFAPMQIIATLGPASSGMSSPLHAMGATAMRLNASHMTPRETREVASAIRRQAPDCPIVVDLQGAKMRLGDFPDREVRTGDRVRFAQRGDGGIPIAHTELYVSVGIGETLSCDDGRLRFRIVSAREGVLEAVALNKGTLRRRKGVNVVEHPVALDDLPDSDVECIRETSHLKGVSYAFSFMNDGKEAAWIRRRAHGCAVVGKIERREAAERAHEIAHRVDALWICRGDLGAQVGAPALVRWVAGYDPNQDPCPVLMAGQVLHHLTDHAAPTRSEICHIFDLVARGYSGFVLSDETAIGRDPAGAVGTLRSLLAEIVSGP